MQRKKPIYRVKGLVRTAQSHQIWDILADIKFSQTPHIKFSKTLQDERCDKEIAAGKRRHKRRGYGKLSYLQLMSPFSDDMRKAHDELAKFFEPGYDSSKL